jgi:hypothetical protein
MTSQPHRDRTVTARQIAFRAGCPFPLLVTHLQITHTFSALLKGIHSLIFENGTGIYSFYSVLYPRAP